jgi:hypothetical protein
VGPQFGLVVLDVVAAQLAEVVAGNQADLEEKPSKLSLFFVPDASDK